MRSAICGNGDLGPGEAMVTVGRAEHIVVLKGVPALVCDNCRKEYLDSAVCERLGRYAEEAAEADLEVQVRVYCEAA